MKKKHKNKVFKKPKREWKKSKWKREKKRILPVFSSHFLVSFSIPRCVVFSSFISVSVFFVPFSFLLFSSARICGCMKKCLPWRRKKKHWMLVRCDLALRVLTHGYVSVWGFFFVPIILCHSIFAHFLKITAPL